MSDDFASAHSALSIASAVPSTMWENGSSSGRRNENTVRSRIIQSAANTSWLRSTSHASAFPGTVAGAAQIVEGNRATLRRFEVSRSGLGGAGT